MTVGFFCDRRGQGLARGAFGTRSRRDDRIVQADAAGFKTDPQRDAFNGVVTDARWRRKVRHSRASQFDRGEVVGCDERKQIERLQREHQQGGAAQPFELKFHGERPDLAA